MITGNAGPGGAEWPAARDAALTILHDALEWELPGPAWESIAEAAADLAAALAAGNEAAFRAAVIFLQSYSPLRGAIRLGDTSDERSARVAKDRIVDLITNLDRVGGQAPAPDPRPAS